MMVIGGIWPTKSLCCASWEIPLLERLVCHGLKFSLMMLVLDLVP